MVAGHLGVQYIRHRTQQYKSTFAHHNQIYHKCVAIFFLSMLGMSHAGSFIGLTTFDSLNVLANSTVVATQAQTLSFTCSSSDPVMAYQIGDGIWSVTTCSPPTQTYSCHTDSYCPRDPRTYRIRTCTTDAISDTNPNSTVPNNIGLSQRRLLFSTPSTDPLGKSYDQRLRGGFPHSGLPEEIDRRIKPHRRYLESSTLSWIEKQEMLERTAQNPRSGKRQWTPDLFSSMKRNEGQEIMKFDSVSRKLQGTDPLSNLLGIEKGGFCYGGGVGAVVVYCPGMNTMSAADIATIGAMEAQKKVNQAQAVWAQNITTVTQNLAYTNTLVDKLNHQYNDLLSLFYQYANTTNARVKVLQDEYTALADATNTGLKNLYANLTQGLLLEQQYTDQQVWDLSQVMVRNERALIDLLNQFQGDTANNFRLVNTRLMDAADDLLQTQFTLYYSLAGINRNVDRSMKYQYFFARDQWRGLGYTEFHRPSEPGQDPIPISQQTVGDLKIFAEKSKVNYMTTIQDGVQTVIQAHQYGINTWCNVAAISEQIPDQISYQQLMSLAGPTGCIANATSAGLDPVYACRCWYEITHKYCEADTGFEWKGISTTTSRDAYVLTADYCKGGAQPTSGPLDGTLYDDILQFTANISGISCNSHPELYSNDGFQVVHERTGVVWVPANYDSSVCTFGFMNTFIQHPINSPSNYSLPFELFSHLRIIWPVLRTEKAINEIISHGVVPGGLTTVFDPLVRGSVNNRTTQCYDTAIDTLSEDTNIIYRCSPQPVVPLYTTVVYRGTPDCTTTPGVCTCVGCEVISSSTVTSTITTDTTGSGTGFSAETVLMGELVPESKGGMSYVVDAPAESKCSSPDAETCKGTGSYIKWSIPSSWNIATNPLNPPPGTLSDWETDHRGAIYEHGVTTALDYWERPVTQGRCDIISDVPMNEVCTVLSGWNVYPTTDMRAGGLTLAARVWTYIISQNIQMGRISTYTADGCPTSSVVSDSTLGTYISVVNPSAYTIYVRIDRAVGDPSTCATLGNFGSISTGIGPRIQVNVPVPANCGNMTVQVYRVNQATGQLAECGPPLSTYVSTSTQSTIFQSQLNANQTTALVVNNVAIQTAAVTQDLINLMIPAVYESIKKAVPINITLDEFKGSSFDNSSLQAFINQLQIQAQGINVNNPTFQQQFDILTEQLGWQAANLTQGLSDVRETSDEIHASVVVTNANVAALAVSLGNLQTALSDSTTALNVAIQAIKDSQTNGNKCDFICNLTNIGYTLLTIAIIGLIAFVVIKLVLGYDFNSCLKKKKQPDTIKGYAGVKKNKKTKRPSNKQYTVSI